MAVRPQFSLPVLIAQVTDGRVIHQRSDFRVIQECPEITGLNSAHRALVAQNLLHERIILEGNNFAHGRRILA